jgi:integrase
MNEQGERKRKTFSGVNKSAVNKKIKKYIADFNNALEVSDEARKTLRESLQKWLEVFKFTSVERTTYDRNECIANNQVYPKLGDKVVGDITSADIKSLMNYWMNEGYAYTTVKKVYVLLNEYFRYLYQQEIIPKNPMANVEMIKKANFMSAQGKEDLPISDTVTIFTDEEIESFKKEAFSEFSNGKRKYQQAAAYILMMNTGMRTGEILGLINSDIDIENRVVHLNRGVKEISRRTGTKAESGREVNVGKLKSKTSKRDIPLNDLAIEMIEDLRDEYYFGEDSPLIPDKDGQVTRPANFRKRYYRILAAAEIETKGLHSLRHTFATKLINGRKDKDGNIKSLTPRQVADLLGHTTSEITELYYVKRDMKNLSGITDDFEI